MDIFCPNNHLVLASSSCPQCGWKRPLSGSIGTLYWPPIEFNTPIGGVSRSSLTSFASINDKLLLSTKNNELASISMQNGEILWRVALPKGQRAANISIHDNQTYLTVQDTHTLTEGIEGGYIATMNLANGSLSPIYKTSSHDLTEPLFIDGRIYLRTAKSEVLCLNAFDDPEPAWAVECQTWWPAPLTHLSNKIIYSDGNSMLDETDIVALDMNSGDVAWTYQLPNRPSHNLSGNDRLISIVVNNRCLIILDSETGEELYNKKLPRIYNQPVFADKTLYYVARGEKDSDNGYYQLHALDTTDFSLKFQKNIPQKVQIPPLIVDNVVYLADYNAHLKAVSACDGSDVWSLTNKNEDVILTTLHQANNQIFYGTFLGKVYAVTICQPEQTLGNAQELLESGDNIGAAAIYALEGNFDRAAQIYIEKIHDIEKALRLYEEGGKIEEAAKLAFENKKYSKALDYYQQTGDKIGQAETLLAMGDLEASAKFFYEAGKIEKAARLMEEAGKLSIAANMYLEAGKKIDWARLLAKTSIDSSKLDMLRKEKNYQAAAEWELNNGLYLEAAKDFREGQFLNEELKAYKQHIDQTETQPGQWVWRRIADLGTQLKDYQIAAKAWIKLDDWEKAGAAYQAYGEELAAGLPEDSDFITEEHLQAAEIYQKAAEAFKEEGLADAENECRKMVRKLQKLPIVIVTLLKIEDGLREGEWRNLELTFMNIGFGRARKINFSVNKDRFDVEDADIKGDFNLAPQKSHSQIIHIKPNMNETGGVPLQIRWSWENQNNIRQEENSSITVQVAREREDLPSQPVHIQLQNIYGDLVTRKGDDVHVVTVLGKDGKQNSEIALNSAGISLNTGGGVPSLSIGNEKTKLNLGSDKAALNLAADPEKMIYGPGKPADGFSDQIQTCRNCGAQIQSYAKFCTKCGTPIAPGQIN